MVVIRVWVLEDVQCICPAVILSTGPLYEGWNDIELLEEVCPCTMSISRLQ